MNRLNHLQLLKQQYHWLMLAAILIPAFIDLEFQYLFLFGLLMFLPLTDPEFKVIDIQTFAPDMYWVWLGCAIVTAAIMLMMPDMSSYLLPSIAYVAIPEEWFFRAYLMRKFKAGWQSVLIVSFFFALTHYIYRWELDAWLVFIPSLIYSWYYLKYRDLLGVVLIHATSNIAYVLVLQLLKT